VSSQEPTTPDSSPTPAPGASRAAILSPGQIFDPVARALEVIGDRWSLVLVRQLLGGPMGFQELRVRTGIAPRVLSSRLRQLTADGFVESVRQGARSQYAVSERGRSLEPIISAIARWWIHHGIADLEIDTSQFTATSPLSVIETLPLLLREDRAKDADVIFEIRLTGEGGGVWTVAIRGGHCEIRPDFAERADVRYTADARLWCAVALGVLDARDAVKRGLMTKDGADEAMDHYFHQLSRGGGARHLEELEGLDSDPNRNVNQQNSTQG
jgi:DNA-binding HxlR family transcriptional regulator